MKKLGLNPRTDAHANGTTPSPITLPKRGELDDWVRRLPVAHTGELSRTLHESFNQLRDATMDNELRLDTLEALRRPLEGCQFNLQRHYRNRPLPVPGKGMRVFHLTTTLHYNMAQGYMRVLDEASGQRWLLASNRSRQLALCAQRAWFHMGRVLADYRHFNLPAPSGLWRHMYLVLRKAQSLNIETLRPEKGSRLTALDEFIAQLLLSQFPDQQLGAEALERLRDHSLHWAGLTRLRKVAIDGPGLHIHADTDRPPSTTPHPGESKAPMFLDLTPLLKRLDRETKDETRSLAMRCLRSDAPREERLDAEGERTLVYGLSAIFQRQLQRCDEQTRQRLCDDRHPLDSDEIVLQEAWLSNANNWVPVYGKAPRHWSIRFQDEVEEHGAQLVNDSPGGVCLSLAPPKKPLLHTGGLVAVERRDAEERLGVIRWIRPCDRELLIGIEWLADKIHPLRVRIGDEENGHHQPALLAFNGTHGIVITARLPGIRDKALWLEIEGEHLAIDTQSCHAESPHIIAFHSPIADEVIEAIEEEVEMELEGGRLRYGGEGGI